MGVVMGHISHAHTSGVAAIWAFWIYPGAAKLGLKRYSVENILHFQKYSEYKVFHAFFVCLS